MSDALVTLSESVKQAILAEVPKYPEPRSVLLMALHFIQAEIGYVPHQHPARGRGAARAASRSTCARS